MVPSEDLETSYDGESAEIDFSWVGEIGLALSTVSTENDASNPWSI